MIYGNMIMYVKNTRLSNTMEIYIKDEMLKMEISNINIIDINNNNPVYIEEKLVSASFKQKHYGKVDEMIADLEAYIKKPIF